MTNEMMDLIVKIVISIASVLITGYLIPYIRSKVTSTRYNDFLVLIEKCVESANQIYSPEQWRTKKNYVLNLVTTYARNHGVDITDEEIDALIEGFVIAVKGN